MIEILMKFILPVFGWLVKPNQDFFRLLKEFSDKLPPTTKEATKGIIPGLGIQHLDLSTMKHHVTEKEVDIFLRKLEQFDYSTLFFKRRRIEVFSKNLQRLLKAEWTKFSLAIIQQLLNHNEYSDKGLYLLGPKVGKRFGF